MEWDHLAALARDHILGKVDLPNAVLVKRRRFGAAATVVIGHLDDEVRHRKCLLKRAIPELGERNDNVLDLDLAVLVDIERVELQDALQRLEADLRVTVLNFEELART